MQALAQSRRIHLPSTTAADLPLTPLLSAIVVLHAAPLGETSSTQAVTHRQSDSPALLINERSTYSAFRRAFAFHEPLDPASIKARLEHGQLRVSVQKKDQPEGEGVVEIQVE